MLLLTFALFACSGASPTAEPSTPDATAKTPPAAEAPKTAAAPDAPTPAAKPWRLALQYGTQEAKDDIHHALDYEAMRTELLKRGILVSGAKPPYGVKTIKDENMKKIDSIDLTGLPKGDYGWIFVEQGREPIVVESSTLRRDDNGIVMVVNHDRAIYVEPLNAYFGTDVPY